MYFENSLLYSVKYFLYFIKEKNCLNCNKKFLENLFKIFKF